MKKGKKKSSSGNTLKITVILLIVAIIFAVAAIVIHHATRITNESYENCAPGDVNGDGYINSSDSLLVIKSMSEAGILFENQKKNADVNKDGFVNSADALILLRYAVGEISHVPYNNDVGADSLAVKTGKKIERDGEALLSTAQILNEWSNGDGTFSYQINLTAKNKSENEIEDWSTVITLSDTAEISKSWDCKCDVDGDKITVSGEPVPTETAAVCGLIVIADEGLSLKDIVTE